MIVKVEWKKHDRTYKIGLQTLLKELKIDVSDNEIKTVIKRMLKNDGLKR